MYPPIITGKKEEKGEMEGLVKAGTHKGCPYKSRTTPTPLTPLVRGEIRWYTVGQVLPRVVFQGRFLPPESSGFVCVMRSIGCVTSESHTDAAPN